MCKHFCLWFSIFQVSDGMQSRFTWQYTISGVAKFPQKPTSHNNLHAIHKGWKKTFVTNDPSFIAVNKYPTHKHKKGYNCLLKHVFLYISNFMESLLRHQHISRASLYDQYRFTIRFNIWILTLCVSCFCSRNGYLRMFAFHSQSSSGILILCST